MNELVVTKTVNNIRHAVATKESEIRTSLCLGIAIAYSLSCVSGVSKREAKDTFWNNEKSNKKIGRLISAVNERHIIDTTEVMDTASEVYVLRSTMANCINPPGLSTMASLTVPETTLVESAINTLKNWE